MRVEAVLSCLVSEVGAMKLFCTRPWFSSMNYAKYMGGMHQVG
jgi:hypothetical protein